MPSTYNGIGTMYYGKKNVHEHQGNCESCTRHTTLRSYDTTKYFVIAYIPIFPLGKKRVIDECSICRRHHVLKLSQWEKMKIEASEESYNLWFQEPNDIEKARKLLETIILFRNVELLNSIKQDMKNSCINNPEILALLGDALVFFNQLDEAESVFEALLSMKGDIIVREKLAEILAKNLKPDKARNLLTHIFDFANDSKLYYVFLIIESYQFIGEHSNALELIDKVEEVFPEMKNDKKLKNYRKKSEKYYNTDKSVKGELISTKTSKTEGSNFSFALPKFVPLIMILFLILIYASASFFMGLFRSVYVVNGLETSYSIEIDGDKVNLPPKGIEKIKVSEGTKKVSIVDSDIIEGEFEFEINTPFWKRPFIKKLYILNPDKVAVLLRDETIYVTDDYKGDLSYDDLSYKYYTGNNFYEMNRVNFLFKEFPEEIEMSLDKVKRTRLAHIEDIYPMRQYMDVLDDVGYQQALSHIESKIMYNPDDERSLQLFTYYSDEESCIDFFRSKLEDRPVLVNLHIYYQNLMEEYDPSYDLKEEYTRYLENEKDNNELYYLLSRAEDDLDKRIDLLERSIEGENPSAFGYYILGYINQCMGNFEKAYDYVKEAVKIRKNQESFVYVMEDIMLSLKMYDDLLERNRISQQKDPYNGTLAFEEVLFHMYKGDVDAARGAILNYLNRIETSDSDTIQMWEDFLEGIISYCLGQVQTYAHSIEKIGGETGELAFENAFIKADYDKAADIALNDELGGYYFLLLYLAENNPDKASEYLNYAAEQYKEQDIYGTNGTKVAEYLMGTQMWTIEDIRKIDIHPTEKLPILLALAKQQPAHKEELLELARKLNYRIVFPNHFIKNFL